MRRSVTSEKTRAFVASKGGPVAESEIYAWAPSCPKPTIRIYLKVGSGVVCCCVCSSSLLAA